MCDSYTCAKCRNVTVCASFTVSVLIYFSEFNEKYPSHGVRKIYNFRRTLCLIFTTITFGILPFHNFLLANRPISRSGINLEYFINHIWYIVLGCLDIHARFDKEYEGKVFYYHLDVLLETT